MSNEVKRIYNIYQRMKQRCSNPKYTYYKYYGEKGIIVCHEWASNFDSFLMWSLKNGYNKDLTLDRIDGNKGYEPNNCRWVTRKCQANNTKSNVFEKINDELLTLSQISEKFNIPRGTIQKRYNNGLRGDLLISKKHFKYGELKSIGGAIC